MGQYYKAYVMGECGDERIYCPHNAVFMAKNGMDRMPEDIERGRIDDPNSFFYCMSGLKLTEHSWMSNDFIGGVMDAIEYNPSRVAWIGDYADDELDFTDLYTRDVYEKAWGKYSTDYPFERAPKAHGDGYIVNHSKGMYIDLDKYYKENEVENWGALHPLSLMTAIGNGRGGGDYRGVNSMLVGTWAMDIIEYVRELQEPDVLRAYDEFLPIFDPTC